MSAPIAGENTDTIGAHAEAAEPEVSPVPPLFYAALFIPTFAVVVWGLQKLMAPRVSVDDVLAAREPRDPGS